MPASPHSLFVATPALRNTAQRQVRPAAPLAGAAAFGPLRRHRQYGNEQTHINLNNIPLHNGNVSSFDVDLCQLNPHNRLTILPVRNPPPDHFFPAGIGHLDASAPPPLSM
jgi:hypothetical protein